MTHTMQETQVHCSGVVQWWAYSSLMSASLPAEAGCKTCEQIILLLVFIVQQWHGNKLQMFTSSYNSYFVSPHVTVERSRLSR